MKSSFKLSFAVALALGLAACGHKEEPKKAADAAPAPPPAGLTVTIAHAGPLTGSIAHLGKDDENGVALAISQANDKKIVIDGKPVTFKMVSEDDQADPKVGTTVAQKLVDEKVAAVIGHLNSGVSIPASEIYNKAGIPMISGSATNPQLTERGLKTVFRTVGRDDQQGPAIAAYIAHELKAKKVALIDDKTAYGEGLANEVEKTLKADKVNVVTRERTTDKETDFKAILTKIKAKNPDVIFHGGMDATGGPMLKQARELGIKAVFAFGDGACTDEMGKLAGAAAEGMVCSQAGLPREAASKDFVDAFNAKFGEIKQYAPYFYDGTQRHHRGHEEGQLRRPGQVHARDVQHLVHGRHRQGRVRRQGRPQGRRDDDLQDEGRQGGSDLDREERRRDALHGRRSAPPRPLRCRAPAAGRRTRGPGEGRTEERREEEITRTAGTPA